MSEQASDTGFTTDWPLVRNKSGSKEGRGQKGEGTRATCHHSSLERHRAFLYIHAARGIITPRLARAQAFILPAFVNLGRFEFVAIFYTLLFILFRE